MSLWIFAEYLGYFAVGLVLDVLLTINWRLVNKEKPLPAAMLSFVVTITSMIVFYSIINELDPRKSILAIMVYALGVGCGTFLGMKLRLDRWFRRSRK